MERQSLPMTLQDTTTATAEKLRDKQDQWLKQGRDGLAAVRRAQRGEPGDALIPGSTDTRKAVTAYRPRTAAAHLSPLKVKREEGQDGHPNLVPLRGHVQPNEGCTPRELNAFKPHRCCPVMTLRAVWQVAADSFTTGGNSSLAQAQATTDERRCRCRSASSRTACPLW